MSQTPRVLDVDQEIKFLLGQADTPYIMGGAYDAADRYSRSFASWAPPILSPDAEVLPAKDLADARSRDITRNDAYAATGIGLHKDNVVGSQFMLSAKPNLRLLGLDEGFETAFQEEVEAKWDAYAEGYNNWIDASRRNTFTSFIRLAVGVYVTGGEVLATSEWMRDRGRPFQTAFQMVDSARLSDPGDRAFDFENVRGGVEVDSFGAHLAYYIRHELPGSRYSAMKTYKWSRHRARNRFGRPLVFYISEQGRPGQTRGISQLVAALKEMKTTQKFRDVTLQNAVVNASYAASIESELPSQAVFESLGSGNVGDSVADYATAYLGAVSQYSGNARNMLIDGVKIPHLFPGTKLSLHPMGQPGGVGSDFEASLLRYIAANLNVSYEELSRDYTRTNYSSARAGMLNTWKAASARKRMVAHPLATLMYRNWFEEAANTGQLEVMKSASLPSLYEGLHMEAYTRCEWIGAARGQIDELKETQAAELRLKTGLSTYEEELARQGKDWRQVFSQRRREQEQIEAMGLVLTLGNAPPPADDDEPPASGGQET